MSQFLTGSLCLTDIIAAARAGHSAFSKGKNGKVYMNVQQWINPEPDDYGNDASMMLNSRDQETREQEGKVYIGNLKIRKSSLRTPQPVDLTNDLPDLDADLPF